MKIDPLIDTIKRSVATGTSRAVRITESSFIYNLFGHQNAKRYPHIMMARANFIIILIALLVSVIVLGCMFLFFINSVLMPSSDNQVNYEGGLRFKQSCGREYVLYLLTPSRPWNDTGIELSAGDKVSMTISGSFYSDITDMVNAAEQNTTMKYPMFSMNDTDKGSGPEFAVDSSPIGTVLYQIVPHSSRFTRDPQKYKAWPKDNKYIDVEEGGTLILGVNDILVTESVREKMQAYNDSIEKVKGSDFAKANSYKIPPDSTMWYSDNIGELLVTVMIERNIWHEREMSFIDKVFSSMYRAIDRK